MRKYTITLYATQIYSQTIEVYASDLKEADQKATEYYDKANVSQDWEYQDGDVEIDIDLIEICPDEGELKDD